MLTPPIDYSQSPSAEHVEILLRAANYWPTDNDQIDGALLQAQINIAGAVAQFERRTGWHPFVSSGVISEIRRFSATDPYGVLDLRGGLLTLTSLTIGGSARTINENVWALPANASNITEPYTQLQIYGSYGHLNGYVKPNQIVVTGEWGRFRLWPADAWQAVLREAALQTLTTTNQEQDMGSISEDGFSESYDLVGPIDPKTIAKMWPDEFEKAVQRFRRIVV